MDDKKLLKECKKGSKPAFNMIITKYYPYVTGFLLKLCEDEEITKDITQEVFLKMIENIENYDLNKEASFGTYIISIAKNKFIDYTRKNKNINDIENYEISTEEDIVKELENKEDINKLYSEIDKLPLEQKETIKLKYFENLTLKEIASKQNVKERTIKSRIYEAKQKLKRALRGD